jgi:hypothetical protein
MKTATLKNPAPAEDPVNRFLRANRPSAQDEDKALVEALIAKIGARLDKAQTATHHGRPFDLQRFITETARDLREIDLLQRQWTGAAPMALDTLASTILGHVRGIDAWKNDRLLLERHAAAAKVEEPKLAAATQQVEYLRGAVQRGEIGCLLGELPEAARRRTVGEALRALTEQEARTLPLGTTKSRSASMRSVLDIAGRSTVTDAIAPSMPVVDRHSSLEAEREVLERKCNASHPQTREFDQLIAELAALKVKTNAALEAEASERQQKAAHLVGLAGAGDIDAMIELQRRTSGPLPDFSALVKRARADESALAATVGEIIRSNDENLARQSPKK